MPDSSDPDQLRKMLDGKRAAAEARADVVTTVEEENRRGMLQSVPDIGEPGFQWTVKRRRFVYLLARTGDQGQSALDAGYSCANDASRLLKYATIQTALQREVLHLITAEGVSQESIISKWATWSDADIFDYFQVEEVTRMVPDPESDPNLEKPEYIVKKEKRLTLRDFTELSEAQRKSVKKISTRDSGFGQNVIIELEDRQRPLDRLAEFFGMIKGDNVTQDTPQDTARQIRDLLQEMNSSDGTGQVPESVPAEAPQQTQH